MMIKPKIKIAATPLTGYFDCYMFFLDKDERLVSLLEHVEFNRLPFTGIKHCGPCGLGLIEGVVCNAENVHMLRRSSTPRTQ